MKKKANIRFNLYRFSMGWDWQAYRPEYEWFTLDAILNGKDERWNKLVSKNPSLQRIALQVQSDYNKYTDTFAERYNVSPERVKDFYNMYLGYHPAYGAYMVGIGPYVGEKKEDEENKFGYFTMRYASTDSRSVLELLNLNYMKNPAFKAIGEHLGLERMNDILAPEDFTLTIRHKVTPERNKAGEVFEVIDLTQDYLAQNNYQKAIEEGRDAPMRSVMGLGSYFSIKPKGVFKLLMRVAGKDGQEQTLKQIILDIAKRRGVPQESIVEVAYSDKDFTQEVVNAYSEINPVVTGVTNDRRAGSQQTEALQPSREQQKIVKLMKEISEIAVRLGTEDPTKISQALNARTPKKKGKAQGQFTPEIVTHWLEQIKFFREEHDAEGNVTNVKTYEDMVQEFEKSQTEMRQGFDDMEMAVKFASLRFAEAQSTEIDPVSGAKLISVPSTFEMPSNVNMTSQDLTEMRFGEGIPQQNIEEPLTENIEETVQPDQEGTIEDIEVEKPSVKTPPQPLQPVEEMQEMEQEDKALARTLSTLKKIATDLRRQGKGRSAWGIERVIRKYEGKKL